LSPSSLQQQPSGPVNGSNVANTFIPARSTQPQPPSSQAKSQPALNQAQGQSSKPQALKRSTPFSEVRQAFASHIQPPNGPNRGSAPLKKQPESSQNFRAPLTSTPYERRPPSVNGSPASTVPPWSPLPPGWEKRKGAGGKSIYYNRNTSITTSERPTSGQQGQPTQFSTLKKPATVSEPSRAISRKVDSDSEDILQSFRVPEVKSIKFNAVIDGFTAARSSPQPVSQPNLTTNANHQKKQSYEPNDVKRVKTVLPSSPRPPSSPVANPPTLQPQVNGNHQRQSQRESKPPKRFVTEKPQLAKPRPPKPTTLSPSRPSTPTFEPRQRKANTPPRSQISVVIPISQHKSKQNAFNLEEDQGRKSRLLRDMKRDVAVARARAKSVERYFGTTGFSEIYGTSSDEERLRRIHKLQPRAKKVKRKNIKLDWGTAQPTTPFRPQELIHPRDQIKDISKTTVLTTSGPPLTFVNDVNDRQLNGKFQFISEYVIREGVKYQPAHQYAHVNCSDTCGGVCSPTMCSCMRNDKVHRSTEPVRTYRHRADGLIVLSDEWMSKKVSTRSETISEIMECNNNCRCDAGCYNRVVQRGRTLPLEVFMTETCGFGIRCPQNIVKGQFIDVYLGELVTESMLERREKAAEEGEPSYLFSLDWFNEKGNTIFYQIDGANFGTPMRFVNHSCNANCAVFSVMLKEYDQSIYGLAVFALKEIPAMTELTLDYAPLIEEEEDLFTDRVICQCGEKNCRGWLWPKSTKRARRRKMVRG
jgi:[histone H3]-lysine9 N-trimethyltransferase SUV39H